MLRHVLAGMAVVSSSIPLSTFGNVYLRIYSRSLDGQHCPLYHLEVNHIIQVLIDLIMLEFKRIVTEHRGVLRNEFLALTTGYVMDSSCREAYGVILVDHIVECYYMDDG